MRCYESNAIAPIRDKVLRAICETFGVGKEHISPTTPFVDAIGADSLDIVELVMSLEEELGFEITEEDAAQIITVGDIIDFVARRKLGA